MRVRDLVILTSLLVALSHSAISQAPGCPNFTPPLNLEITTSFCTDTTHGWVALYYALQDRSSVAATSDGGKHWAIHEAGDSAYSPTSIVFLNDQNGWLMLYWAGSMPRNLSCKILTTQDGGATWTEVHPRDTFSPCGEMQFISRYTGWVVGSYSDFPTQLWITRDGGRTWKRQALPKPKDCGLCEISAYHAPPEFQDAKHGKFEVEFSRGMETFDVTYITVNGGNSWKVGTFAREVPSY